MPLQPPEQYKLFYIWIRNLILGGDGARRVPFWIHPENKGISGNVPEREDFAQSGVLLKFK
jgi:hypothetical protein